MSGIATQSPATEPLMLQIADSKQVYAPGKGLTALEKSVLSALRMIGSVSGSLCELTDVLTSERGPRDAPIEIPDARSAVRSADSSGQSAPWLDREFRLPTEVDASLISDIATRWNECCRRTEVELMAIWSEIVQLARFNERVRAADNKSLALSRLSLNLLRSV